MSRTLAFLLIGAVAAFTAIRLFSLMRRPTITNYRGVPLTPAIGFAMALLATIAAGLATFQAGPDAALIRGAFYGLLVVGAVGAYDDHRPGPSRGILRQVRLTLRGHLTPGAVKLAGLVAAAVLTVLVARVGLLRTILAIPVLAGTANLWNLLDVRPGRALKYFIVAAAGFAAAMAAAAFDAPGGVLALTLGAALVALRFDLTERSLLGDTGANPLGFVIGVAAVARLPDLALGAWLAAVVCLHVLSETVTLSRIIRAAPPLRWFDDLGRIKQAPHAETEESSA